MRRAGIMYDSATEGWLAAAALDSATAKETSTDIHREAVYASYATTDSPSAPGPIPCRTARAQRTARQYDRIPPMSRNEPVSTRKKLMYSVLCGRSTSVAACRHASTLTPPTPGERPRKSKTHVV